MTALRHLERRVAEQRRLFIDPDTSPAGALCDLAASQGARVIHMCGPRPGVDAAGFAAWRDHPGGGWEPRAEGHHLRDLLVPVLRYQRAFLPPSAATSADDLDRRLRQMRTSIDIRHVGEWFGDHTDATPAEAEAAFGLMRDLLARRVPGAILWASPQATGTDLLLRTLPKGREWAPLDDGIQAQIRSTATQGRVETFPRSGPLPNLVELDGRFMYAALLRELAEGDPVIGEGWPDPAALGYLPATEPVMVRGRFLVEWRPPAGWAHVGILPYLGSDGWTWPTGRRWRKGWVDGAELLVAVRWGWEVKVRRHLAWPRPQGAGPLAKLGEVIVAAREQVGLIDGGRGDRVAGLAAAGLRQILLTTIGVLHGRSHDLTRTGGIDDLPSGRAEGLRPEGTGFVWTEKAGPARAEFAHPEWSAAIWARCRARLLDGRAPGGIRTGALHLDPATIVGFSVDALYLTVNPGWPDDQAPGRLRHRATYPGPLPAPADRAALLILLREARSKRNAQDRARRHRCPACGRWTGRKRRYPPVLDERCGPCISKGYRPGQVQR